MQYRWKKRFGQHLLHDHNIIRKIISALKLSPGEYVVEIGSGSGALTRFLVKERVNVFAVEIDPQFYDALRREFGNSSNCNLIGGDILDVHLQELLPANSRAIVTGNLPYNITSGILFHFFTQRELLSRMVFLVQKEVARRITAPVHTKDRSILSVFCQFHSHPEILFSVSRNCFYPKPQVDSAVISLDLRPVPGDVHPDALLQVVKTCFSRRRKTLRNTLALLPGIHEALQDELESGFDLNRRPEELEVDEFVNLTRTVLAHRNHINEHNFV